MKVPFAKYSRKADKVGREERRNAPNDPVNNPKVWQPDSSLDGPPPPEKNPDLRMRRGYPVWRFTCVRKIGQQRSKLTIKSSKIKLNWAINASELRTPKQRTHWGGKRVNNQQLGSVRPSHGTPSAASNRPQHGGTVSSERIRTGFRWRESNPKPRISV